jgi:hypothetical protein
VSGLDAVSDGVRRIDPGLNPVGDRRPRDRRQPPFPEPGDESEREAPRAPASEADEPPTPAQNDPDGERHVDIRVLPTRQFLPARPAPSRLH